MRGYLSLGSNLGDRSAYLIHALDALVSGGVRIIQTSSVYETRPVEVVDTQRNYYNLAVCMETHLSPHDLLSLCNAVENDLERERPYVHSPRTIDIDIILLEGITISTHRLRVPHPGMENRSFVILPLAEIAPDIVLPSGRPILNVKKALGDDEVVKTWKLNYG
ncbi:MAG TPA: 2-amino-4-hydroxy-6-hydroxymethyldihydropteridine diphosphokinase [Deltaproteobacteria bacterium]|nr:2-amino-4-hydroxy-6-hydroxymethyldihydropteridine diphosphokinase [Deltaproteobacteria bacterium]